MKINIGIDEKSYLSIQQDMKGLEGLMPYVAAAGLTRLAVQVKQEQQREMRDVFDRPTPFTLNSVFVKPASVKQPQAIVWFKDRTNRGYSGTGAQTSGVAGLRHYLYPQVYGGKRQFKRSEALLLYAGALNRNRFLVPGREEKTDRFGNLSRGTLNKVLSAMQAQADPLANQTERSKKRRSKKSRVDGYFAATHRGKTKHLKQGIYRRYKTGFGYAIKPVMIAVENVNYEERYPFFDVVKYTVQSQWEPVMNQAFSDIVLKKLVKGARS